MVEIWLPVVGFSGYEVSNLGRVRSRFRILKQFPRNGYPRLTLRRNGKTVAKSVHVLVAETFIGPRPPCMHVCHFDGDTSNPQLDNLRYDTQRNNVEDAIRHGSVVAKLSDDAVRDIRGRWCWGAGKGLARQYGVSESTISAVIKGKSWRHVE